MVLILEFNTYEEANTCLYMIHSLAANWWTEQGYIVENNQVIGKNAKTHSDEPTKSRTLAWDTIKQSPDNTYYFTSLTGQREAWSNWKTTLAEMGFTAIGTEKEFPVEWIPVE